LSAKRIETNDEIQTLKTGGMPLGMKAGVEYTEKQFPLQRGDVVIFITDGIIEARDSEEQQYSQHYAKLIPDTVSL